MISSRLYKMLDLFYICQTSFNWKNASTIIKMHIRNQFKTDKNLFINLGEKSNCPKAKIDKKFEVYKIH